MSNATKNIAKNQKNSTIVIAQIDVPNCSFLFEEAEVFGFKVGGEDVLAYGIKNLLADPESAAVKFIGAGVDWAVIDGLPNNHIIG